jgi:hypothetical protein
MLPMSLFLRNLKKASPADYSFVFEGLVGTIEMKASLPTHSAYVQVTSLLDGKIAPVSEFRFSFSPGLGDGRDWLANSLETAVIPFLRALGELEGSIGSVELGSSEVRSQLAFAHMVIHEELGNLGSKDANLNLRTARQYEIAKAFGVGTAVALIAKFESVGPTVITRRLTRARDAGLVEKLHNKTPNRKKVSDPEHIFDSHNKESDLG